MLKIGDILELTIDRLSSGGRGVGRYDEIVVFVPFTAPEELVSAQITAVKKNFLEAKLVKILEPSKFRIAPPCPVAGTCGGCTWQHIAYEEQLRQKQNIVADAFRKFAKRGVVSVTSTVPSPKQFHYRNKIQLHFQNERAGYFEKGTSRLIPIESCLIADPLLNQEVESVKKSLGQPQNLVRKEIYLTETGRPAVSSELRFEDELGFSQVNEEQNQNLLSYVSSRLGSVRSVFDLYSGGGNFALRIARDHPEISRVVAVEKHPKSVESGKKKAQGFPQVSFVGASVSFFLTEVVQGRAPHITAADFLNSCVILDPPRAGCEPSVIPDLVRLGPKTILYVSCDPVTLARDVSGLPESLYELRDVQPFDMFPQTDHVETIVHLERRIRP